MASILVVFSLMISVTEATQHTTIAPSTPAEPRLLQLDVNDVPATICIYDPPPTKSYTVTHSCNGKCGRSFQAYRCQCDELCLTYGDCCFDYEYHCTPDVLHGKFNDDEGPIETLQSDVYMDVVLNRRPISGVANCVKAKPNSDAFGMLLIDTCSEDVDRRCVGHSERCDPITFIPVYGTDGRHYKNRFCALCNGLDEGSFKEWKLGFECFDDINPLAGDTSSKSTRDLLVELIDQCDVGFEKPAEAIGIRYCVPAIENQCHNDFVDLDIIRACQSYSAPILVGDEMFKNPHCAACKHANMSAVSYCVLSDPTMREAEFGFPTTILFDFSPDGGNSRLYDQYGQHSVSEQHGVSCGVGATFDPYVGRCRQLHCGANFKLLNGSCVLDPKLSSDGFDYNFTNLHWQVEFESRSENKISYCSIQAFLGSLPSNLSEYELEFYLSGETNQSTTHVPHCVIHNKFQNILTISGYGQKASEVAELLNLILTNAPNGCVETKSIGFLASIHITNYDNMSKIAQSCDRDGWYLEIFHSTQYTSINNAIRVITDRFNGSFDADFTFQNHSTYLDKDGVWRSETVVYLCIPQIRCPMIILSPSEYTWIGVDNDTLLHIQSGQQIALKDVVVSRDSDEVRVCRSLVPIPDQYRYPLLYNTNNRQTLVSQIGGVVSMVALFLVIITYVTFPALRNIPGNTVMNLSFALLVAQMLLQTAVDKTSNYIVCFVIATCMHYFWLAVFLWTNVLAYDLGRTFGWQSGMRSEPSKMTFLKYCLYGWGLPLILVGITVTIHFTITVDDEIQNVYDLAQMCWIIAGYQLLAAFGAPVALVLMGNVVFFGYTVTGIVRTRKASKILKKDTDKFGQLQEDLYLYIRLSVVIGLTWITGFIIPYTRIPNLWYVFIVLNSLQGPVIFVSFAWNDKVRRLWRRKIRGSLGLDVDDTKTASSTGSLALSTTTKSVPQHKMRDFNEGNNDGDMNNIII